MDSTVGVDDSFPFGAGAKQPIFKANSLLISGRCHFL